uniref:Uncharacterized protein n=1 Tax=Candidatus Kentrum sp. FW TaxID=2126338 RepID=A0A450SY47_9GAMM|nr:MAG: hypothetical protein BECKFW1821B_GA0114236_100445 [Candidatus Kentron sp. FW]VFJ58815.1 MAG: hypothetical protein BECKFW1821A_GA0114235_10861 [Candidatus Kentron sp. FW]
MIFIPMILGGFNRARPSVDNQFSSMVENVHQKQEIDG